MKRALEVYGYRVLEAGNFDQAVTLAYQGGQNIDMLVTDISLPGTNGCELARYLLKGRPNVRLLFVSGHTGAEICRYYGISVTDLHFMRKPIRIGEFVTRVREILASEARLQSARRLLHHRGAELRHHRVGQPRFAHVRSQPESGHVSR